MLSGCGHSMWDLTSLTRDWTHIPCIASQIVNHWTVGSRVRHYWQNGGMALNPFPLFCRKGPGMKELGFVILTCFFLSLAELTEENIKVLIVFERSMRRHKAFCSCAQRIIHEVNHWHFFKGLLQKSFPGWAHRPQLEAMGGIAIWSPFVRKVFMAKEFAEFRAWKWSRSVLSDSATPWMVTYQAPQSMGFSRQEYWSGVPSPSPSKIC